MLNQHKVISTRSDLIMFGFFKKAIRFILIIVAIVLIYWFVIR